MFGFAAFSDGGFSSQTTSDARIIAGTQVVTGPVAGATILAGAIVPVTTAGSLTSATGTTAQTVIALPATNVIASSIAGVTPETRVIATTAGAMTATVQAMGNEYTLKLIKIPGTNVMTSSIAGVTTGVVIPIGSANLGMTSTVQAMGTEYTLKLIKIPETNLLTGSTGSPSLFTWVDVNDNVTAETWTDVETEDSTESWSNV